MARTFTRVFQVSLAAGITPTAPLVTTCQLVPCIVDSVSWLFPDGCNGLVGIQVGTRNVPLIPYDRGQFIVNSGNSSGVDVADMLDSGDWSVIGYNQGASTHVISVTFNYHIATPAEKAYFILDTPQVILGIGES